MNCIVHTQSQSHDDSSNAVVTASVGPGVHLVFAENEQYADLQRANQGIHICVYPTEFARLYQRLNALLFFHNQVFFIFFASRGNFRNRFPILHSTGTLDNSLWEQRWWKCRGIPRDSQSLLVQSSPIESRKNRNIKICKTFCWHWSYRARPFPT
jgi:hypothetical protein